MPVSKTYNYTTFDDPIGANGTNGTYGEGSNASGKIVGYYYDSSGNAHGFLKTDGSYITLDFGNNDQTFAQGINASGQIVGWYNDLNSDHAFLYGGGSFTTLKDLGTVNTFAEGINASGQIVGYYQDGTLGGGLDNHGFLYAGSTYITLDDPLAYNPVFSTGTANGTTALSINASGKIVGYYYDSSGLAHGFLYSGGNYTTLDDPLGADGTFATGINDAGQIVGYYFDHIHDEHGFVYSGGNYTTLDGPLGANGAFATGINNAGQIVGDYLDASHRSHGFLATPTNPHASGSWRLGGFAVDPPTTSMGDSSQAGQLVQAMARFGGGSGGAESLNIVALGADTSQQSFLTTPQHV